MKVYGHIGDRGDSGSWDSFIFEVLDNEADQHTITIDKDDLPEGTDWDDLFDYLDALADENDVDYDNGYGESE